MVFQTIELPFVCCADGFCSGANTNKLKGNEKKYDKCFLWFCCCCF